MKTFLLVVLGVIAGVAILVVAGLFWLRRKAKGFLAGLQQLAAAFGGSVPPLRITLEPCDAAEWSDRAAVDALSAELAAAGYSRVSDYTIAEMDGVLVRGFGNSKTGTLAALFEHPQAGLNLDLLRLHSDRYHVLVTTAPDDGLDHPPNKHTVRITADLTTASNAAGTVIAMHEQLLAASEGHPALPLPPRVFALTFATAYATEMDWRIRRGGVTADEVRRVAELTGEDAPDESAVELVQSGWQRAIDEFVSEQVREAVLAASGVSATAWENVRDRAIVVHEHARVERLIEELSDAAFGDADDADEGDEIDDDRENAADDVAQDAHAVLESELRSALQRSDKVSGFAAAVEKLPPPCQYQRLGEVHGPWRGAVYAPAA